VVGEILLKNRFSSQICDSHGKEEEGREERGEERRKEVAFHPQNAPVFLFFSCRSMLIESFKLPFKPLKSYG
jgi:hypothetical protein